MFFRLINGPEISSKRSFAERAAEAVSPLEAPNENQGEHLRDLSFDISPLVSFFFLFPAALRCIALLCEPAGLFVLGIVLNVPLTG